MNKSLENYIKSKEWTFKLRNGEYALDLCPLCNAGPGHFYINGEKEVFYCQKCTSRGHILSLKKKLGDIPLVSHVSDFTKVKVSTKTIDPEVIDGYHKALLQNPAAFSYLTDERGFSLSRIMLIPQFGGS